MTASREHACAAALLCALALAAPLARAQFSWPEVANQDALQRGEVCVPRAAYCQCGRNPSGFIASVGRHAPVQCCALLPWLGGKKDSVLPSQHSLNN